MPIYARTSGGAYKAVSKILTADGSEIGKVADSTGRIVYEASRLITVTDVPPISFAKSIGKPLVSWDLLGNSQQTGTPSPDNIIMPEFVGVRTAQLFDISTAEETEYYINNNGKLTVGASGDRFIAQTISVNPLTKYTFSWGDTIVGTGDNSPYIRVCEYVNAQFLGRVVVKCIDYADKTFMFETGQNTTFLDIRYESSTSTRQQTITNLMVTKGDTALFYEPYGWKISINCAGQTTPVYLGQVETTRWIKKLVLTGEESYSEVSSGAAPFQLYLPVAKNTDAANVISNFYQGIPRGGDWSSYDYFVSSYVSRLSVVFRDIRFSDLDSFVAWIAQQYTAGTPVTIWYVLAEPETGIVNEPLAKIGDYADELHSTDAGVVIQTTEGNNTLTVGTDLPPSSMTITYKGR